MVYPSRRQEKKLVKKGFRFVAGVDETGRGSWAGPLVAAAVILDTKTKIKGIKDSKLLRAPERNELFQKITAQALAWSIGIISHETIDEIGMTKANELAMIEALKHLPIQPQAIITDALKITYGNVPVKAIIKGDRKVTCVAAASIVAKVYRDNLMDSLDDQYPQYGFKQHKGYGTNHHFHMLNVYGVADIHRKSFKPIKDLLAK